MSKHLILILLLVSLAFNLAVLGIFLYSGIYHRPPFRPDQMMQPWGRHEPGNWHRRDSLESRLDNNDEIRQLRLEFMQARKAFMQVMMKDQFVEKDALAAMETSLKAQQKLEQKLGESLISLRQKLSADEAKKLFQERMDRMDRRWNHIKDRLNNQSKNKIPLGEKP
jgi:hypothetical protein